MSNIKEAEEQTGISRANIRYYEKMGLLQPKRNEKNGCRAPPPRPGRPGPGNWQKAQVSNMPEISGYLLKI